MNDEELKGYPRFQYSIFPKGSKDEQFVVRANTFAELQEQMGNIQTLMTSTPVAPPKPSQQTITREVVEEPKGDDWCPIHKVEMKRRVPYSGVGFYFDHRRKNEQDEWESCNGITGWKVQASRARRDFQNK